MYFSVYVMRILIQRGDGQDSDSIPKLFGACSDTGWNQLLLSNHRSRVLPNVQENARSLPTPLHVVLQSRYCDT